MPEVGVTQELPRPQLTEVVLPDGHYGSATEAHHTPNQDSYVVVAERGLGGVFDALSTVAGGAVAAQTNKEFIERTLPDQPVPQSVEEAKNAMARLIINTHENLQKIRQGHTTAVIAQLIKVGDQTKVIIGHAGDSRAYRYTEDQDTLQHLTIDDTPIASGIDDDKRLNALQKEFSNVTKFSDLSDKRWRRFFAQYEQPAFVPTEREVAVFQVKDSQVVLQDGQPIVVYKKNPTKLELFLSKSIVTQYLGDDKNPISPQIAEKDVKSGDIILLASDGLENLTDKEKQKIIKKYRNDPQALSNALTAEAKKASLKKYTESNCRAQPDDITIVAMLVP